MNDKQVAYISGPMRNAGPPDFNSQQFSDVETAWHADYPSSQIVNPARNFGGDKTLDVATYMQLDLRQVLESTCLVMLPEWWDSEGARLEAEVALATGKRFYAAEIDPNAQYDGWTFSHVADWEIRAGLGKSPADGDQDNGTVRTFDTGATRDTSDGKLDYEGFLSPLVIDAYAAYMHEHRLQSDGTLRSADNWQKGMPQQVYMSSMWRHFMDVWKGHRDLPIDVDHLDALMALMFNVMGYAHELLRDPEPEPAPTMAAFARFAQAFGPKAS